MRRALPTSAAVAVVLLALSSSALAYVTVPTAPAVTGTCTINPQTTDEYVLPLDGVDVMTANSNFQLGQPGVRFDYWLYASCGGGANYVFAGFSVYPAQWSINDNAGTLTVTGLAIPSTFNGESSGNGLGRADITSPAGPIMATPLVYGADNATEKKTVVSYHRKIDAAKTDADRVGNLNLLLGALS